MCCLNGSSTHTAERPAPMETHCQMYAGADGSHQLVYTVQTFTDAIRAYVRMGECALSQYICAASTAPPHTRTAERPAPMETHCVVTGMINM